MPDFYDVAIIGGADGPTAIMVAGAMLKPLAIIALAAVAIILLCIYIKHNNE